MSTTILTNLVVLSSVALILICSASSFSGHTVATSAVHEIIRSIWRYRLSAIMLVALLAFNMYGNLPGSSALTNFYCFSLAISFTAWFSLVLCALHSGVVEVTAHMLPYGSPVPLMVLLPLIEVSSQFLRPFTLSVRLSTNLAAGHILIYIFCFFCVKFSSGLVVFISFLQVFELAVSVLQAYIFISLVGMYYTESLEMLGG